MEINGTAVARTTTSYTKSSLAANTDYTVRVRAKNSGGAGDWSEPVTVKTLLITPMVTAVSTSNQITLNWTAIAGATEYEVEVDGTVVSNGTDTTYVHTGLTPSTTHTYTVRAKSIDNLSIWSVKLTKSTL